MRQRRSSRLGVMCAFVLLLMAAGRAHAHAQGETYIWVNVEETHFAGSVQLRIPDLREYLGLGLDRDPEDPEDFAVAQAAVEETLPLVAAYIRAHVSLTVDGRPLEIEIVSGEALPAPRFGHYASYRFRTPDMTMPESVTVRSELFFENDPRQRSLICIEYDRIRDVIYGEEFTALILNPANPEATLSLANVRSLVQLREIARRGAVAWAEPRHGLFLLVMLLPVAVAMPGRRGAAAGVAAGAEPATSEPAALIPVTRGSILRGTLLRVVAFTIPAGIGLAAASAGFISMRPSVTATVATASILVLCLSALMRIGGAAGVLLVSLFGLFHGIAFADLLMELPFRMQDLVRAIVLFGGGLGVVEVAGAAMTCGLMLVLVARPRLLSLAATGGATLGLIAGGLLLAARFTEGG